MDRVEIGKRNAKKISLFSQ